MSEERREREEANRVNVGPPKRIPPTDEEWLLSVMSDVDRVAGVRFLDEALEILGDSECWPEDLIPAVELIFTEFGLRVVGPLQD